MYDKNNKMDVININVAVNCWLIFWINYFMDKIKKHFWDRDEDVYQYVCNLAKGRGLVVDAGCGEKYFEAATELIDYLPLKNVDKKLHNLDVSWDKLPYKDKEVDFLYCRHTLEDVNNPRWLIQEINRVAKAGYIETPSPIVELARGADAVGLDGSPWRGYYHHRSIVWSDGITLSVVPKYPIIEHININDKALSDILSRERTYWNTYYLWEGEIKADFSFGFGNPHSYDILQDYGKVLSDGVEICHKHTKLFLDEIKTLTK